MASKKTLEKALNELEDYMYFSCKDNVYDCPGNCDGCNSYAVTKKDFIDACKEIRKEYETK